MKKLPKRRWRNYVINPQLQLRYTAVMVALSAFLTAGLGYFWYAERSGASELMEVRALATMSETEANEIAGELDARDQQRLVILIGFGLLLALFLTGLGFVLSHRVAGPMYRFARHMRDIAEGRLAPPPGGLRKGDFLQEVWAEFLGMYEGVRKRAEADIAVIEQTIQVLDPLLESERLSEAEKGTLKARIEALSALRAEKAANLERSGARSSGDEAENAAAAAEATAEGPAEPTATSEPAA